MAESSLGTVSVKITADGSQLATEFKRAEAQVSVSAAKMDDEVGNLQKKLKRRFNLGSLGVEVLRGAGIFGGFQIAEKAAEHISKYWKEAADAANEVAAASERMAAANKKTEQSRLNDAQRLKLLQQELAAAVKENNATKGETAGASGGERLGLGRNSRAAEWVRGLFSATRNERTPEQEKAQSKTSEAVTRVANEIKELTKKIADDAKKAQADWSKDVLAWQKRVIDHAKAKEAKEKKEDDRAMKLETKYEKRDSDSLSRIGGFGGAGGSLQSVQKQQTDLLTQIRDLLRVANGGASGTLTGYFQ